jgi:hypothetical protein
MLSKTFVHWFKSNHSSNIMWQSGYAKVSTNKCQMIKLLTAILNACGCRRCEFDSHYPSQFNNMKDIA